MRLFDKALTQSKRNVRAQIEPILRRCVVLNADRICEDIYKKEDDLEFADYPYFVPPWETCFVEWRPGDGKYHWGAIVEQQNGDKLEKIKNDLNCPHAARALTLRPMRCHGKLGFHCMLDRILVATTSDGLVIAVGYQEPNNDYTYKFDEYRPFVAATTTIFMEVIGMAFTFANCKNVKLGDVTERDEPIPKIKRRLGIPDVKRYTLYIDGKKNNPLEATGLPEHVDRRWHLCRGHFADYTAERPLFGRLVGKFWIPQHTRGSKSVGVVEKDYAIAGATQTA